MRRRVIGDHPGGLGGLIVFELVAKSEYVKFGRVWKGVIWILAWEGIKFGEGSKMDTEGVTC